jgi:hypothetical protein
MTQEQKEILAEASRRIQQQFAPLCDQLLPEDFEKYKAMRDDTTADIHEVLTQGLRVTEMIGAMGAYNKIMGILTELMEQQGA